MCHQELLLGGAHGHVGWPGVDPPLLCEAWACPSPPSWAWRTKACVPACRRVLCNCLPAVSRLALSARRPRMTQGRWSTKAVAAPLARIASLICRCSCSTMPLDLGMECRCCDVIHMHLNAPRDPCARGELHPLSLYMVKWDGTWILTPNCWQSCLALPQLSSPVEAWPWTTACYSVSQWVDSSTLHKLLAMSESSPCVHGKTAVLGCWSSPLVCLCGDFGTLARHTLSTPLLQVRG